MTAVEPVTYLRRPPRRPPDELVEDVEWLADTGESWTGTAQRVGLSPTALDAALRRAGRPDLVERLRQRAAS